MYKAFTIAAAIAASLIAPAASAVPANVIMKVKPAEAGKLLPRDRVVEVVRARHIRLAGDPYLYNGRYIVRCYDRFGRLAYCQVDPYSGAFIGIALRL